MKVAFVYDRVNKWGGAERVLLELQQLFPDATLYTSVYNKDTASWANRFSIHTSFLQTLPFAKKFHEFFAVGMPIAFEQFVFDDYDLVISVTSESAKGILTKPTTKHICYCLTPTRYLWSGYDEYFSSSVFRSIASPAVSYLRKWDSIASNRPDVIVGISETVRDRIKTYYNKDAKVIYPPVTPPQKRSTKVQVAIPEDYFLVVSRLVPYKKVELAVRACNELRVPLVVVGSGSEEKKLRQLAGPSITFLGSLTDEVLAEYYENCNALLFPGEEDFGITVVEAQSFGKPVLAYHKGGATETIINGKTGVFFLKQTVASLKQVIQDFNPKQFSADACLSQAEKFSGLRFRREFQALVAQVV